MSNVNVKKVFKPLVELLESNQDVKVKDLLQQIYEMTLSNNNAKTFKCDEDGSITHIFCYYHKKWEDVAQVEFGKKASSTTGLNTMCKEGLSHWNKQQREYKKAKSDILDQVVDGTLSPDDVQEQLELLEGMKNTIVPREDNHGSDEI
tara:strand:+ start:213 stop:656 length:444 start_codon:yes stop_codon:yes gene_type:complete